MIGIALAIFLLISGGLQAHAALLVLGDSITRGAGGYAPFLSAALNQPVVNVSQNGASVTNLLSQWNNNKSGAYSHVLMLGGVNDLPNPSKDAQFIFGFLETIVNDAISSGTVPVVMTIMPWSNWPNWSPQRQQKQNEVNSLIRGLNNIILVDTYAAMGESADPTALNSIYDSGDGLHPNSAGRQFMATLIEGALMASVPEPGSGVCLAVLLAGCALMPGASLGQGASRPTVENDSVEVA